MGMSLPDNFHVTTSCFARALSLRERVAEGRVRAREQALPRTSRERSLAVGAVYDRAVTDRAYSRRPLPQVLF
jgi:hypothetical protein